MPSKPQPATSYTPLQQDRQARNRPSHILAHSSSTSTPTELLNSGVLRDETFESRERRRQAAMYLESNEMLIWYASSRNESVPQTRLHFEKILAGHPDPPAVADWADDYDNDTDEWEERASETRSDSNRGEGGAGRILPEEDEEEPEPMVVEELSYVRKGTPSGKKVTSPRSKTGREKRKDGKRRSGGGAGGFGGSSSTAAA